MFLGRCHFCVSIYVILINYGKSWNLIIRIPDLESHGFIVEVMESHGKRITEKNY